MWSESIMGFTEGQMSSTFPRSKQCEWIQSLVIPEQRKQEGKVQ
jgi:hypothetical protein